MIATPSTVLVTHYAHDLYRAMKPAGSPHYAIASEDAFYQRCVDAVLESYTDELLVHRPHTWLERAGEALRASLPYYLD